VAEQLNGKKPTPAIVIFWDNDKQAFSYQTDGTQIKNPEMLEAILGMCHEAAQFNTNVGRHQRMQQAAMQAAQEDAVRRQIIH
jgi:hypothetical protein